MKSKKVNKIKKKYIINSIYPLHKSYFLTLTDFHNQMIDLSFFLNSFVLQNFIKSNFD